MLYQTLWLRKIWLGHCCTGTWIEGHIDQWNRAEFSSYLDIDEILIYGITGIEDHSGKEELQSAGTIV